MIQVLVTCEWTGKDPDNSIWAQAEDAIAAVCQRFVWRFSVEAFVLLNLEGKGKALTAPNWQKKFGLSVLNPCLKTANIISY